MKFRNRPTKEQKLDWMDEVRYGTFDNSGFVGDITVLHSSKDFAALNIPNGTKPFLFPTQDGYVPVYLKGDKKLDSKYSRDGIWLCAEKTYENFERSGSQAGKLNEFFHRVGDIKDSLNDDEFSLKANIFLVALDLFSGIALAYTVVSWLLR